MKAKVIALNERNGKQAKTTVDGLQVKVGDVVDVSVNTFRNLAKKGLLEGADAESRAVKLDETSRLSGADVEENVSAILEEREKRQAAEAAAKAAKK